MALTTGNSEEPLPGSSGSLRLHEKVRFSWGLKMRRGILLLLAVHIALNIALMVVCPDQPSFVGAFFIALCFAQLGLLGIWAGFGSGRLGLRLVGLASGCLSIATLLGLGIGELDGYVNAENAIDSDSVDGSPLSSRRAQRSDMLAVGFPPKS
ncbi:MAG: hypothetical protein KDA99_14495, partial [Planctomycetales bacterium]|nr:hypothetical protein [Planctomycetales bacterium]